MTTIDANSAIGQVQTANNAFAQFFSSVNQALSSGGNFPEFSDSLASLVYTELHRMAINGQLKNANYPDAAAIENVHHIIAVQREYGLRYKNKNQYYSDGAADALNESNYYATIKTLYINMLRGVFTPGETT